ncbi:hypothetical protein ACTWP7_17645, partial [Halobacillus sp. B29]
DRACYISIPARLRRTEFSFSEGAVLPNKAGAGGEMARLPWEKGLGEIPQGVKRARKLTVPP